MRNIRVGELKVSTPKQVYIFPSAEEDKRRPDLKAELRVLSDMFWLRMCTAIGASDLGLAEAFMFGDVACDNLLPVFQVSNFLPLTWLCFICRSLDPR